MKFACFLVVLFTLASGSVKAQNAIVGTGFSSGWGANCNDPSNFTTFTGSAGTSYILTTPSNGIGNQYFRLGIEWNFGADVFQRTLNPGSDDLLTPGIQYTLDPACTSNGAMYINVTDIAHNYIFKTRNAGTNPTGDFVIFQVEGDVREVSSITQSPTVVSNGQAVTVTANLSGTLNTGQSVYLRYTDDSFATSTVVEMTGSLIAPTAEIPSTFNTASADIEYYVFTSGSGLTISGSDADLFTINLNNGGLNYSYVVQALFALFDDFDRVANTDVVGLPSDGGPASWDEIETNESGARILGSSLRLQSDVDDGRESVSYDMTSFYPVAFDASTEDMKWALNMRSNRNNPSGFSTNNFGSAFIIGCDKPDYTDPEAFGYALVIGGSDGSEDEEPLRLVRFEDGLTSNTHLTEIASITLSSETIYLSVNVSYISCSNTWNIIAREEDSAGFTNPSIGSFPLFDSGIDSTYTASDLPYMGALWNHQTDGTSFFRVDNIYIPKPDIASDNEYTWTGGTTNFNTPSNWTPSRDCARSRDRLVFDGGTSFITEIPDQSIGQLILRNNATVTFRNQTTGVISRLTLTGGFGQDLLVESGSTLNLDIKNTDNANGMEVEMLPATTGEIFGTFRFANSTSDPGGRPHQLLVNDSDALRVKDGGRVEASQLLLTNHPFGDSGNENTVVFESGSTYRSESGGNPFGFEQPASKVVFESGSKFQFVDGDVISMSGRNYADFEFVSGDYSQLFGGNSTCRMDNFTIQSGSLNLIGSNNSLPIYIDVKNDLNIAGGTLNYSPVAYSKMRFSGTQMQSVYGSGTLVLGDSLAIEIENTSSGAAFRFERDLDIRNNLFVIDGQVQSFGARTLSMLGNNSEIRVEADGSIEGTDQGVGNDLTLVATGAKTTISGGGAGCKFFSVTIEASDTLALERGLEVKYGLFNVQDNAKLIINSGGFVSSTSPTYSSSSELIYNTGNSYGRGTEWTSNATNGNPGYPGNVIIENNSILNTDNMAVELGIQNDLIIGRIAGGTGTLDMNSDTYPIQVGGELRLGEGSTIARLTLSDQVNGDIKVMGDFVKVPDDAIGIFEQEDREVIMNGSSIQNIYGVNNFDYLAIENSSSSVRINNEVLINKRLRLGSGLFDLNGFILTMENESEIMREASSATMSAAPDVVENESYDLRYTGLLTTGLEWLDTDDAIRDLRVEADITLQNSRAYNRDLYLNGANLNLNGNILEARGIGTSPSFSGKIDIAQSGNRNINGIAGSRFDIIGLGGTDPTPFTKQVVNSGADTLVFGSDVEVRIGNGGADFGDGNPTLIKGVLAVLEGGYVINNSCNYAPGSILRFANTLDYQVDPSDLTWANGLIESGSPGIPYNVEVLGTGTDLTLNSTRALRNNLTIIDGIFTLTPSSGSFDIGGDWSRTGVSSDFVHSDQEVVFNGSIPQTISTDNGETFYRLSFDNSGVKSLNEDVTVLEDLNIRGSGALNGNSQVITLHGNWNNEVGSSSFTEANSKVVFAGSSIQNFSSLDDETFHDLEMDNAGDGMVMNDPVRISGFITFTNGIIDPSSNDFIINNGGSSNGGNVDSYVNGAVIKIGFTASSEFPFPVGYFNSSESIDVFQPAYITTASSNPLTGFKAEYFHKNYTLGYTNPNNPPPRDGSLTQVSTCNYWIIDRVSGTPETDAIVGLSWGNSGCINVGDPDELRVARWNGLEWDNQGLLYGSGNSNSGGPDFDSGKVYTTTAFGDFSPFAIGTSGVGLNVLPIQLLSFTASANGQVVDTRWATSTETNNDYFTVERSLDAEHFEEVGRVAGAGNSTAEIHYAFADDAPYSGISYYRLKQTDFDGTSTYSQIRAVEIAGDSGFEILKVYRGDDAVNLVYRSELAMLTVEVFDLLGKRIFVDQIRNENGQNRISPSLVRGMYLLRLSNGVEVVSEKFFY